jgi:hypothetical protein
MEKSYLYKADIQQIILIQEDIRLLKGEWSLSGADTRQILVVIEELFSKLITSLSPDATEHIIEIFIKSGNEIVTFTVQDNSYPFNPFSRDIFDEHNSSHSGAEAMDISLMETFIDSYEYHREDEKNVFIFQKTLKSSGK